MTRGRAAPGQPAGHVPADRAGPAGDQHAAPRQPRPLRAGGRGRGPAAAPNPVPRTATWSSPHPASTAHSLRRGPLVQPGGRSTRPPHRSGCSSAATRPRPHTCACTGLTGARPARPRPPRRSAPTTARRSRHHPAPGPAPASRPAPPPPRREPRPRAASAAAATPPRPPHRSLLPVGSFSGNPGRPAVVFRRGQRLRDPGGQGGAVRLGGPGPQHHAGRRGRPAPGRSARQLLPRRPGRRPARPRTAPPEPGPDTGTQVTRYRQSAVAAWSRAAPPPRRQRRQHLAQRPPVVDRQRPGQRRMSPPSTAAQNPASAAVPVPSPPPAAAGAGRGAGPVPLPLERVGRQVHPLPAAEHRRPVHRRPRARAPGQRGQQPRRAAVVPPQRPGHHRR